MSGLEERCQQFHEAALGTGKSKGLTKEITTLRRFLHKNQNSRFTDRATSRLFDAIQIYSGSKTADVELRLNLLEDALKMPYTVFGTKHKTKMLKWLENLRGDHGPGAIRQVGNASTSRALSLIDLSDKEVATLMDDETGETFDDVGLPVGDLGNRIQEAFLSTEGVLQTQTIVNESTGELKIVGYSVT